MSKVTRKFYNRYTVYQVINDSGYTASCTEYNDLATFMLQKDALDYIDYLREECSCKDKFSIKKLTVVG